MSYSANKYLLGFAITILLVVTCKKEEVVPTPGFSYDFSRPELKMYLPGYAAGTGIKLTNTSLDAVTYLWDLGDGSTSTGKEPTIAYRKSGTYTW